MYVSELTFLIMSKYVNETTKMNPKKKSATAIWIQISICLRAQQKEG